MVDFEQLKVTEKIIVKDAKDLFQAQAIKVIHMVFMLWLLLSDFTTAIIAFLFWVLCNLT